MHKSITLYVDGIERSQDYVERLCHSLNPRVGALSLRLMVIILEDHGHELRIKFG